MFMNVSSRQSGNAIVLILIGIVLFAALSYAVNRSMTGNGDMGSSEKSKVQATDIMAFANSVATAVSSVRAVNSCSDITVSFENTLMPGYVNPNAPTDKSCHIFDAAGGGAVPQRASPTALDTSLRNEYEYGWWYIGRNVAINGTGASDTIPGGNDLVLLLPYITKSVCTAINKELGYNGITAASSTIIDAGKFIGAYQNPAYPFTPPSKSMAMSGCLQVNGRPYATPVTTVPFYVYYRVLIAR